MKCTHDGCDSKLFADSCAKHGTEQRTGRVLSRGFSVDRRSDSARHSFSLADYGPRLVEWSQRV